MKKSLEERLNLWKQEKLTNKYGFAIVADQVIKQLEEMIQQDDV